MVFKQSALVVVLAWWFAWTGPSPMTDKATIAIVVGPFVTKQACEAEREQAAFFFQMSISPEGKTSPCTERKNA